MTEQLGNESASNFALSLNILLWKLFGWFRRPKLWATDDWELHHNNVPAHVSCLVQSFLAKHQITQVTQHCPLQPRFGALRLLAFPKTEITFEREEIADHQWDSGKYDGTADSVWENYVRSQGASFEGDRGVIVLCKMFLISCIFFNKSLFFLSYGGIPSGQTSYTSDSVKQDKNNQKPNKISGEKNFHRNMTQSELMNLSQKLWYQGSWKLTPKMKYNGEKSIKSSQRWTLVFHSILFGFYNEHGWLFKRRG